MSIMNTIINAVKKEDISKQFTDEIGKGEE